LKQKSGKVSRGGEMPLQSAVGGIDHHIGDCFVGQAAGKMA
jgi:hypothetical protein